LPAPATVGPSFPTANRQRISLLCELTAARTAKAPQRLSFVAKHDASRVVKGETKQAGRVAGAWPLAKNAKERGRETEAPDLKTNSVK
jgi:hypothetical protein